MLHYQTVSPALLNTLQSLMALPELSAFRLVGGTSLALQIGHRTSVDIDLFTDTVFDNRELQLILAKAFSSFQVLWQGRHGFSADVGQVKTDVFNWQVAFVQPPLLVDSLRLMEKLEIGAMKLDAITSRKDKKDFIDLFFLLQEFTLADLIKVFRMKYPYVDYKFVIESLGAIDLADATNEPKMFVQFSWSDAKKMIIDTARLYVDELKTSIEKQQADRLKRAEEILHNKKKN